MEEKLRILLCEDDESLGMLLREYLQAKGYEAELFPDGDAGYKAFLKNRYEMCVLDVMMPKKDGFQLAREIQQSMLKYLSYSWRPKTWRRIFFDGFKIGADDYITKPFSMEELVFRMEAILRRVRGKKVKETNMYKLGRFTFDTQRQILAIGDKANQVDNQGKWVAFIALCACQWCITTWTGIEDDLDWWQLLQCTEHGCVYHKIAQASERRPFHWD